FGNHVHPLLAAGSGCALYCYRHSIDKIIRRIGNYRIRLAYSAQDFDPISEIAAQRHLPEFDMGLAVHYAHLGPLGLEENGVSWEHPRHDLQPRMKVDLHT